MKNPNKKEHVFTYKVIYTLIIIAVYIVGINIPLYMVDTEAVTGLQIDAQNVLNQALNGDMKNGSIFSLGLWSYMLASMLVMLIVAILSVDRTRKIFPKKVSKAVIALTVIIAAFQAYTNMQSLTYVSEEHLLLTKSVVFLEMLSGMMLVIYLCERVAKYGIGGRTSIIVVNVFESLITMVKGMSFEKMIIPIVISIFEIAIILFMEIKEKRIPVQRVSIHNIYADKNYIAYKYNPVGVMPLMFASAVFMLPQFTCSLLEGFFPDNITVIWLTENMTLTRPLGILVYMLIICIINVAFSFIMLSPGTMADTLLKSGDSILDVYAGRQTKNYLKRTVLRLSLVSSFVMAICQGIPLFLQFDGYVDSQLAMFPCSVMMLTGMWISVHREARVYSNIDRYKLLV